MVLKEAINAENVYMHRKEAAKNGDSGWYFGLLDDPDEENRPLSDFEMVPTYQLLQYRMDAMRVLEMPVGTVAVFSGNQMTALVDANDNALKFTTEEERRRMGAKQRADFEAEVERARQQAQNAEKTETEEK